MMVSVLAGPCSQPQVQRGLYATSLQGYPRQYDQFYANERCNSVENEERLSHRQWPWRILPFCSDLGTVGYLINRPKVGLIGWLLAMPYYLYAVLRQPDSQKRKEEVLYQSTANGLFPLVEAKMGINVGYFLYKRLTSIQHKKICPIDDLTKRPIALYKLAGGLLALAIMTPMLGDPFSHWIGEQYKKYSIEE